MALLSGVKMQGSLINVVDFKGGMGFSAVVWDFAWWYGIIFGGTELNYTRN